MICSSLRRRSTWASSIARVPLSLRIALEGRSRGLRTVVKDVETASARMLVQHESRESCLGVSDDPTVLSDCEVAWRNISDSRREFALFLPEDGPLGGRYCLEAYDTLKGLIEAPSPQSEQLQ